MKRTDLMDEFLPQSFQETIDLGRKLWHRHPIPVQLFLLMCLNLVIAPVVYAATGDELTRKAAWGLGILGLVTFGLSVYLFVVIFQPERF